MEAPGLPSRPALPSGFANAPEDILRRFFETDHRSAHKFCSSFPRMRNLCQTTLWKERAEREFGPDAFKYQFYKLNYLNYLAARVLYLQNLEVSLPALTQSKSGLTSVISGVLDKIQNCETTQGRRFTIVGHRATDQKTLSEYFSRFQINYDRYLRFKTEAKQISLELANYLDNHYPDTFDVHYIEMNIRDVADILRSGGLSSDQLNPVERQEWIDRLDKIGLGVNSIAIISTRIETNQLARSLTLFMYPFQDQVRFVIERYQEGQVEDFEGDRMPGPGLSAGGYETDIVMPDIFYQTMEEMGLTLDVVNYLYGMSDERFGPKVAVWPSL